MRFLITSMSNSPMPPEMVEPVFEGTRGWIKKHTASGKMEQAWSYAGLPGGGGILNVSSHEELDAIMSEFPLGAFSEMGVFALADVDAGLKGAVDAFKAMSAGMG